MQLVERWAQRRSGGWRGRVRSAWITHHTRHHAQKNKKKSAPASVCAHMQGKISNRLHCVLEVLWNFDRLLRTLWGFQGDRIPWGRHCIHLLLVKRNVGVSVPSLVVPSLRGVRTRPGRVTSSSVFVAKFTLLLNAHGLNVRVQIKKGMS